MMDVIKDSTRSPGNRVVAKIMYIFQTYKNTVLDNALIINKIVLNMNKLLTISVWLEVTRGDWFLIKDLRRLRIVRMIRSMI